MRISDTKRVRKGTCLLKRALFRAKRTFFKGEEEPIRDEVGVFAYVGKGHVLTAKSYAYGNLVSCHRRALDIAINHEKEFVMYLGKNDAFYSFDPVEIRNDSKTKLNLRGKSTMINFNIRLGRRLL